MQVAQFTEFAQKIAALNEAQHPLMGELDAIKERIHEFEDRREAAQVSPHSASFALPWDRDFVHRETNRMR